MKAHPLITLLLVAALWPLLPATAQKLVVDRFEETNDLAASQYPRKDANGKLCALVKIEVIDNVTKVEGGVIGNIVNKRNEKWVYIAAHQRTFKVYFSKHAPVSISTQNYSISELNGGTTYVLTLLESAAQSDTAKPMNSSKSNSKPTRSAKPSKAKNGDIVSFDVCGVSFNMVYVEGGTFKMGASYEKFGNELSLPRHKVTLSGYYIGQTEVTQTLWKAVMGYSSNYSRFNDENLPVESVTWDMCQQFISKLNEQTGQTFSLPTEAEWEFAARGGNKSCGYDYSGSDDLYEVAWYKGSAYSKTHVVGKKAPNELGIYDMSGNVKEWCMDRYDIYPSTPQTNPTGPSSGSLRVARGGSWNSYEDDCDVSIRYPEPQTDSSSEIGLRLAIHTVQ